MAPGSAVGSSHHPPIHSETFLVQGSFGLFTKQHVDLIAVVGRSRSGREPLASESNNHNVVQLQVVPGVFPTLPVWVYGWVGGDHWWPVASGQLCACVEITINLKARIKKAALVNLASQFVLSFRGERLTGNADNRRTEFLNISRPACPQCHVHGTS